MNQHFQMLRDYLDTASRGFATMRGQDQGVARVGYRAGKMFQHARNLLDKAFEELSKAAHEAMETVPPDDESEPPKKGPRKRRI